MDPTTSAPAPAGSTWPREPRSLAAGRAISWWGEGWKIFRAAPVPWLLIALAFIVIQVLLNQIPVIGTLGGSLLTPVLMGGLLLGCHGLAQGRPLAFGQLFAAFSSDRLVPLLILGALMLAASILIAMIAFGAMFGAGTSAYLGGASLDSSSAALGAGMASFGLMSIVGGLFALLAGVVFYMAWWFAPALVAITGVGPVEALKASFRGATANLGGVLLSLLILIVLSILSMVTFGLAWLVLLPVLVGADYASWREVYGE